MFTAIAAYVTALGGLAGFSIYANPWGNYGASGFLDPHEYNDRLVKAEYLDRLPKDQRPQILILGSSSMMAFRPADLTRLIGHTAFNSYVSGAQADDHLCLLRHLIVDLDYRPDWLIVGIETWTFAPPAEARAIIPGARRALINVPAWIRHHPQGQWHRRAWAKTVDCFSREHLRASWRALFRDQRTRGPFAPMGDSFLAEDGTLIYEDDDTLKLGGVSYTLAELRRAGVTRLLREVAQHGAVDQLERLRYYRFDGLWQPRVERFEMFLEACRWNGIHVLLVLTPLHPLGRELLKDVPEHARNSSELEALVHRWTVEDAGMVRVFDASHIESFDGDADDFYDEMHCGPENSRRIIERLAPHLQAP